MLPQAAYTGFLFASRPEGCIVLLDGNVFKSNGLQDDMQIQVASLPHEDLMKQASGESSSTVAARVERAFETQLRRQGKGNNILSTKEIDLHCKPDAVGEQLLRAVMTRMNWSARAYHRVLKVARTIADLGGSDAILQVHVAEAIQYRRALRER